MKVKRFVMPLSAMVSSKEPPLLIRRLEPLMVARAAEMPLKSMTSPTANPANDPLMTASGSMTRVPPEPANWKATPPDAASVA